MPWVGVGVGLSQLLAEHSQTLAPGASVNRRTDPAPFTPLPNRSALPKAITQPSPWPRVSPGSLDTGPDFCHLHACLSLEFELLQPESTPSAHTNLIFIDSTHVCPVCRAFSALEIWAEAYGARKHRPWRPHTCKNFH